MTHRRWFRRTVLGLALVLPAVAAADIVQLARCQKGIAREGAKYAQRVIKATLDCTMATANCQIQCESGVFGPPCDSNPPPCCDPADPGSNAAFGACMSSAQAVCDGVEVKIAGYESKKQQNITNSCSLVTQEELCGTQMVGLNFDALNAGCLALDPTYTCSLTNLLTCVAGPLETQLAEQIAGLLQPRAGDAIAAQNLQQAFPDIPISRKVSGQVAEGKFDVYTITGQADDDVVVRVRTKDDTGTGSSTLHPILLLLQNATTPTPIADTTIRNTTCNVPNVCGSSCPAFKRRLPFSGTFRLAVGAATGDACGGGRYRLIVTSPGGVVPVQIGDDVDGSSFPTS